MRIATQKSWLLAGLPLAGCAASRNSHTDVVVFSDNDGFTQRTTEIRGKPAVIWEATTFRWTIRDKSGTTVSTVNLYVNTTEIDPSSLQNLAKDSQKVGRWQPPDLTVGVAPRGDIITLPTSTSYPVSLAVETYAAGGSVRIDDIWSIVNFDNTSAQPAPLKLLYFDVVWKNGGKTGTSYSRLFATVGNTPAPDRTRLEGFGLNPLLNNTDPVFPEEDPDRDDSDGGGQSAGVGKPTESSTIPGATLATPTNDGGQISSGAGEPSRPKSKKGLSIGAIVGIAIACGLLGLALISGIVFFCLRRRQKQNALGGGTSRGVPYGGFASGGGRNGGDELMAEKEANAGVIHDVTSAPHSPYSDDGHNHQQHLMGMGGAGANRNSGSVVIPNIGSGVSPHVVLPGVDGRLEGDGGSPVSNAPSHHMQQHQVQHDHQSGRSYTMYSDHQSGGGGGGSPTTLHSGGGAPSLTHGGAGTESNRGSLISQQHQGRSLSTPYAHLVEEGMTDEEIRRLEEEERQLDAAIEQHAGGRRSSRNL